MIVVLAAVAVGTWFFAGLNGNGGGASVPRGDRPAPVLVQAVTRENFADTVEALGTTRAAESINVSSRVSNMITAISFEEGEHVEAGEVLIELESSEARADLAAAQATLVESRSQYQRSRELLRTQAVSESRVEELEAIMRANEAALAAAEARLQDHRIRAPFAGTLGLRRVSIGTLVTPGTVITTLDDNSTMLLDFDVPETYLGSLAVGQTLTARSAAYPETDFTGVVATIDSRVDPVTRAVTVRARLPNPDRLLKPGMFMTVRVLRETSDLLLLPEQALVPQQSRQFVFVIEDGLAQMREVVIGRRAPGKVEILEGLREGEVVVVEGVQRLTDGTPVNPRPWREPD